MPFPQSKICSFSSCLQPLTPYCRLPSDALTHQELNRNLSSIVASLDRPSKTASPLSLLLPVSGVFCCYPTSLEGREPWGFWDLYTQFYLPLPDLGNSWSSASRGPERAGSAHGHLASELPLFWVGRQGKKRRMFDHWQEVRDMNPTCSFLLPASWLPPHDPSLLSL